MFERQDRPGALGLSDRERDVLELMASGATNPEIAEQLHLSKHTVKEHTSAVYRKLGVRNRTEAVQRAQRLGLLVVVSVRYMSTSTCEEVPLDAGAERDSAVPGGAGAVRCAGARGAR